MTSALMPRDRQAGVEAGVEVVLDDVTTEDLVVADAAVVATLRLGIAGRREAVRATVLDQRELLLDAEQRLVLLVLLRRLDGGGAGVGRVRLAVDEVDLGHHEHVVAAADRVRVDGDRLSTQSLLSPVAWFVLEPSNPQIGSSPSPVMIFVLERSFGVGSVPSIQMYSAL